jgi:hypothetical protein
MQVGSILFSSNLTPIFFMVYEVFLIQTGVTPVDATYNLKK